MQFDDPALGPMRPTGQLVQSEAPVLAWYFPSAQLVHAPAPAVEYLPWLHTSESDAASPSVGQ